MNDMTNTAAVIAADAVNLTALEQILGQVEVGALDSTELAEMAAIEMQADVAADEAEANAAQAEALNQAAAANQAVDGTVDDDTAGVTFRHLLESVDATEAAAMMMRTSAAFDERAAFEKTKNAANDNIQKTIAKVRKEFQGPMVAACMVALELEPRFINASERIGSRRNVYGLEKIGDLLRSLATSKLKNQVNVAVVRSMVLMEKAGLAFNSKRALAATSAQFALDPEAVAVMGGVRHTVSPNTASTQMSSTMTALQEIGAVVNVGTEHNQVFQFTNAPVVERLKEVFGK